MDTTEHDQKCELLLQSSILEEFGSWEAFNELPKRIRLIVSKEGRINGPVSDCGCARRSRNRNDFIRLWTAAAPAKNYDKSAWLNVERQLMDVDEF